MKNSISYLPIFLMAANLVATIPASKSEEDFRILTTAVNRKPIPKVEFTPNCPPYPQQAHAQRRSGKVILRLFIGRTGVVNKVVGLIDAPHFADQAISLGKLYKFVASNEQEERTVLLFMDYNIKMNFDLGYPVGYVETKLLGDVLPA